MGFPDAMLGEWEGPKAEDELTITRETASRRGNVWTFTSATPNVEKGGTDYRMHADGKLTAHISFDENADPPLEFVTQPYSSTAYHRKGKGGGGGDKKGGSARLSTLISFLALAFFVWWIMRDM